MNTTRSQRSLRRQSGLTLLEILVAIFLIALAFGIVVPSFNSLTHVRLRKTATRLAATMRYLYNQAALKGLCMRMVLNLQADTYHVEASTNGECLVDDVQSSARKAKKAEDDKRRKLREKKKESSSSNADTTVGGWSGEKPISLEVKKTTFAQYNDYLVKPQKLDAGVRFHSVYSIHQKEPYSRKNGPRYAYLHCFPLGRCERGVIYLEDTSNTILSLEIKPLTGRVVVHQGKMELTDSFRDRAKGADDDN